jgi:hypothetical protein
MKEWHKPGTGKERLQLQALGSKSIGTVDIKR